jgi:hypothetical protein
VERERDERKALAVKEINTGIKKILVASGSYRNTAVL